MSTSEAASRAASVDGRRARRERGREAVIDALFELLGEDGRPPEVERLAERAGVSVSSVFRYFGNVADLQREAFDRFLERFGSLLAIPSPPLDTTAARVRAFVDARARFYDATAPILRVGRARAMDHPQLATNASHMKRVLAGQVREHFAPELGGRDRDPPDEELVLLIDSLTSPEAWDALLLCHGCSRRWVERSWAWAVEALLVRAGSPPQDPTFGHERGSGAAPGQIY